MNYKATVNKITQYEIAMLDENVSGADFSRYMSKIHTLREQLFYSLIDLASKNKEFKKVLTEDALRFILLEENLLIKDIPSSQFSGFLKEIEETYLNLKEIDDKDIILKAIITRLSNVINSLRTKHEERIAEVYFLLNQVREIKQKEV